MFNTILAIAMLLVPTGDKGLDKIELAQAYGPLAPAVRVNPPGPGLHGLPFAPEGLDDCADMEFYRVQWGLPERFIKIGWRESNCRNEDGVRTWCCYGRYQLYVSLFLKDHRMIDPFHECGIYSFEDVNSDTPLDKQRQACGAKALYDLDGLSPWAATR